MILPSSTEVDGMKSLCYNSLTSEGNKPDWPSTSLIHQSSEFFSVTQIRWFSDVQARVSRFLETDFLIARSPIEQGNIHSTHGRTTVRHSLLKVLSLLQTQAQVPALEVNLVWPLQTISSLSLPKVKNQIVALTLQPQVSPRRFKSSFQRILCSGSKNSSR